VSGTSPTGSPTTTVSKAIGPGTSCGTDDPPPTLGPQQYAPPADAIPQVSTPLTLRDRKVMPALTATGVSDASRVPQQYAPPFVPRPQGVVDEPTSDVNRTPPRTRAGTGLPAPQQYATPEGVKAQAAVAATKPSRMGTTVIWARAVFPSAVTLTVVVPTRTPVTNI